jgi:hypothetical protein
MAGLVTIIHVLIELKWRRLGKSLVLQGFPTGGEMSDSSLNRRCVDSRDKPGHDDGASQANPEQRRQPLTL